MLGQLSDEQQTLFRRQPKQDVRLGNPLVIRAYRRRMIRSGKEGGDAERVQGSFHSIYYPFPNSYEPLPLLQIHVHLLSDMLEFSASFVAHFPNLSISPAFTSVLWFWGVIRYAMLVLYVSWSSSGYAQLGLGCKRRKSSTSNSIG